MIDADGLNALGADLEGLRADAGRVLTPHPGEAALQPVTAYMLCEHRRQFGNEIEDAKAPPALEGSFDEAAQMKLTRKLARTFGYDMNHGRVDKAVHPFSSGSGLLG